MPGAAAVVVVVVVGAAALPIVIILIVIDRFGRDLAQPLLNDLDLLLASAVINVCALPFWRLIFRQVSVRRTTISGHIYIYLNAHNSPAKLHLVMLVIVMSTMPRA